MILHTQMIIPVACRTHEGAQRLLAAIKARAFQADALAPALKRRASWARCQSTGGLCYVSVSWVSKWKDCAACIRRR